MSGCGGPCCRNFACCSYPHKKAHVNWTLTLCVLALLSLLIGGGVDVVYFCLTPILLLCLTACTQINRCGLVTAGILSLLCTGLCVLFASGIHSMVETCRESNGEVLFDANSRLLKRENLIANITINENDNLQSSSSLTDDAVAVAINSTSVVSAMDIEAPGNLDTCDSLHVLFVVWCIAGGLWFLVGCLAFFMPSPKEHEYESLGDVDGFLTPSAENVEGDTVFDEMNTPNRSEVV